MLSRNDLLNGMSIKDVRVEAFETYLTVTLKNSTGLVEVDGKTLGYYGLVNPKIILNEVVKLRKLGYFVEVCPDKLIISIFALE